MMLLQYAVWGAWLPIAARYLAAPPTAGGLGFSGTQIGMILGLAGSLGAVLSPFIAGQICDRYFRTEYCLAVLLASGGVLKWVTAYQTGYGAWLILSILYSVVYMPTLALTNSLAFTHLENRDQQFPRVRVWGTLGWIAASWVFPMIWLQTDLKWQWLPPFLAGPEVPNVTGRLVDALKFSGMISLGYALFCLALPATPPKKGGVEPLAFARAFRLLKTRSFLVLVIASLPISIIHQIYFLQTPNFLPALGLKTSLIGPVMTVGQFAELVVMVALGWMIRSWGFRRVISLGAAAYVVRYAIWSIPDVPLSVAVVSQALHGFCYACFFAGGFIYVDRVAPEDVRHSAQTVFGILILGGGPVIGGWLSGYLQACYTQNGTLSFSSLWQTLALIGLLTTVFFALLFRQEPAAAGKPAEP
jgi:nucleoside transporter